MKNIILLVFCSIIGLCSFAQVSDTVEISFYKSAYLIFDDFNFKFDVGSEDVIARKSDNKLIIQAEVEQFEETNLFVEASGRIYLFILKYGFSPKKFVFNYTESVENSFKMEDKGAVDEIEKKMVESKAELFVVESDRDKKKNMAKIKYADVCEQILEKPSRIYNLGIAKYKLRINLRDLIIVDDKMFLRFEMVNNGNIPYVFDYYKYKVVNVKRKIKGESYQLIELFPLYEHNRPKVIEGKSTIEYVVVIDKFVLTENKKLRIEHWEDNGEDMNIEGGRKIDFDVFYKDILNVSKL